MFRQLVARSAQVAQRSNAVAISKCFASSFNTKFEEAVNSLPLRDAVRYTAGNMKWSAADFLFHIESHANALVDSEFAEGETVAVWIPECAEKHVALAAAAKAGLKVVDIDPSITDIKEFRQALALAEAKMIYFSTENIMILRKAIPEFFEYDDSHGKFFHSKHFPTLKYFIHLGPFSEVGALNYNEFFLRNPDLPLFEKPAANVTDATPLYRQVIKGKNGIEATKQLTHAEVLSNPNWAFAQKVINKEYFEL